MPKQDVAELIMLVCARLAMKSASCLYAQLNAHGT